MAYKVKDFEGQSIKRNYYVDGGTVLLIQGEIVSKSIVSKFSKKAQEVLFEEVKEPQTKKNPKEVKEPQTKS